MEIEMGDGDEDGDGDGEDGDGGDESPTFGKLAGARFKVSL